MKGAWSYADNKGGRIVAQPLPQIGFLKSDSSFEYYLIDKIPTKQELETRGFQLKLKESIRILGCENIDWHQILVQGIPFFMSRS